jgi:hypothetical protein
MEKAELDALLMEELKEDQVCLLSQRLKLLYDI